MIMNSLSGCNSCEGEFRENKRIREAPVWLSTTTSIVKGNIVTAVGYVGYRDQHWTEKKLKGWIENRRSKQLKVERLSLKTSGTRTCGSEQPVVYETDKHGMLEHEQE